jgi:hypothetical protein
MIASMISDPHPMPVFMVTLLDGSSVQAWSPEHLAVVGTPEWDAHLVALRDVRRLKGPPVFPKAPPVKSRRAYS